MIIKKKITRRIEVGDILIVDWKDIESKNLPISLKEFSTPNALRYLKKKFEGESSIFLFEVDDISYEYADYENKTGTVITFNHINIYMFRIQVTLPIDFKWTVIANPWTSIECYLNEAKNATPVDTGTYLMKFQHKL